MKTRTRDIRPGQRCGGRAVGGRRVAKRDVERARLLARLHDVSLVAAPPSEAALMTMLNPVLLQWKQTLRRNTVDARQMLSKLIVAG